MPETTENAPESKTETCPKKSWKDCGCGVCIAPYIATGIIFLLCWGTYSSLSCRLVSNMQDSLFLAVTVFGSGLVAALIAAILALPRYLIIKDRNRTELKKLKLELKHKSKS